MSGIIALWVHPLNFRMNLNHILLCRFYGLSFLFIKPGSCTNLVPLLFTCLMVAPVFSYNSNALARIFSLKTEFHILLKKKKHDGKLEKNMHKRVFRVYCLFQKKNDKNVFFVIFSKFWVNINITILLVKFPL